MVSDAGCLFYGLALVALLILWPESLSFLAAVVEKYQVEFINVWILIKSGLLLNNP
jgi:hypothetical protein